MPVTILGYRSINSASETGSESIEVPAGTTAFALFVGGFLTGTDTAFDRDTPTISIGGLDPKFRTFTRNAGNSTESDVTVYAGSVFPTTWGASITFSWAYSASITNGYMFCLVFYTGGYYNSTVTGQSSNTGDVSFYDNSSNIVLSGYYGSEGNGSDTSIIAAIVSRTIPTVTSNGQEQLTIIGPDAKGATTYMAVLTKRITGTSADAYVNATNLSYPGCAAVRIISAHVKTAWMTA